jgi:biopolymer transport protein ExbB
MKFDLAHIWASMGIMSRLVAFALVAMAIASIAVVVERLIALSRQGTESRVFAREVSPVLEDWDPHRIIEITDKYPRSALARLFGAAFRRFQRALDSEGGGLPPAELARREMERKREAIVADLRRGMSVLASVGSIAPFVGLLGTVVGIISAFQGIASTGSGGLSSVSAGISEALVETALGLAVAIPAVLAFHYLTNEIAKDEGALNRSAGELLDHIEDWEERAARGGQRRDRVA